MSSSGMGKDVTSLTLSIQHFLCKTMALPTLKGALRDGFWQAVLEPDMPEPCQFLFLSLDSSKKRFLWTHKEADLALHPVFGFVLQVGKNAQIKGFCFSCE